MAAIFGPMTPDSASHVQSICNNMDIPHIEATWSAENSTQFYSINIFPHYATVGRAFRDLVDYFEWTSYTLLYETNEGQYYICPISSSRENSSTGRMLNEARKLVLVVSDL